MINIVPSNNVEGGSIRSSLAYLDSLPTEEAVEEMRDMANRAIQRASEASEYDEVVSELIHALTMLGVGQQGVRERCDLPLKHNSRDNHPHPYDKSDMASIKSRKQTTGTDDYDLQRTIMRQVEGCIPASDEEEVQFDASLAFMHELAPQNALEGRLLAQMEMVNSQLTDMYDQISGANDSKKLQYYGNQISKFHRLYIDQINALQKFRGKGQQIIQVQHVHVNEGSQAVIGDVTLPTGEEGGER